MASSGIVLFLSSLCVSLLVSYSSAGDPSVYYDFEVSYITASPLGVPQQVISIPYIFNLTHYANFTRFLCVFSIWASSILIVEYWVLLKISPKRVEFFFQIYQMKLLELSQ